MLRLDILRSAIAPISFLAPDSGAPAGGSPPPAAPTPEPTPTEPDLSGVAADFNDIMGMTPAEPEATPEPPAEEQPPATPEAVEPTDEPEEPETTTETPPADTPAEPTAETPAETAAGTPSKPAEPAPKQPEVPAMPADTTDYAGQMNDASAKWQAEKAKLDAVEAEIDKLADDDFPTAGMLKKQAAAKREMAKLEQQYNEAQAKLTQQQAAQAKAWFGQFAKANGVDAAEAQVQYSTILKKYAEKYPDTDVRALAVEKLGEWATRSKAATPKPVTPAKPTRPVVVRAAATPGGAKVAAAKAAPAEAANKSFHDRVADGEYDLSGPLKYLGIGQD